jgi:hypothetical protein
MGGEEVWANWRTSENRVRYDWSAAASWVSSDLLREGAFVALVNLERTQILFIVADTIVSVQSVLCHQGPLQ